MTEHNDLCFEDFRLDVRNACVWRAHEAFPLTPKAFAVLHYLVAHPGRLVARAEVLAAIWPDTVVGDAVLTVSIAELRKTLGDDPQAPRFIETVHRRGYRWIALLSPPGPQTPSVPPQRSPAPPSHPPAPLLVGREAELAQLHNCYEHAVHGQRQVVFVTGEPGIGKTTVVEAFLAQVAEEAPQVWVGVGQCIEQYGSGEAYLPVLEALGRLCRVERGARLTALLRQQAPLWLLQLPWLLTAAEREALQQSCMGATRERMLREMVEALEEFTRETSLILVLEDLHWSDYATLDVLTALARRRAAARLLVIGTYRPIEVIVRAHPLKAVKRELHAHGQCRELSLALLTEGGVEEYLRRRFALPALTPSPFHTLAQMLHQRTNGNPLFLVQVVNDLVAQGVISEREGHWELRAAVAEEALKVPEGVRQMIEQQSERFTPDEQRLLEGASVAGVEFSPVAVAAATEMAAEHVEAQCETLARQGQLLTSLGVEELPDGAVAARYGFAHALYQQVWYDRLGLLPRRRMHLRIAQREETLYGDRARERAAALAMHFERGGDIPKAVQYRHYAGENALRQHGYREAIEHLTRGLELLGTVPETPARLQQELSLQLTLGAALIATRSYVALETGQAYRRAVDLCDRLSAPPALFPALNGLWRFHLLRAELATARALGEQLLQSAQRSGDPALLLEAHRTLGATLYWCGEFLTARAHLEQCLALYESRLHRAHAFSYGLDPGVMSLTALAQVLWVLGYPEQARQRGEEALALAREIAHPVSLMHCLTFVAAMLPQHRRDPQATYEHAEAHLAFAAEHGFVQWGWMNTFLRGWALAELGRVEEGITQMRQGMRGWRAIGADLHRPYFLALLADAHRSAGRSTEGLTLLDEALDVVRHNGETLNEAELWRLKGELLLQSGRGVLSPQDRPPTV